MGNAMLAVLLQALMDFVCGVESQDGGLGLVDLGRGRGRQVK